MILAGGAGWIADALKFVGAPSPDKKVKHPIEITGKLILEQPEEKAKSFLHWVFGM